MTWFPDMGTASMVDTGDHIRAVGWLSDQYPYTQSKVSAEFLARLWDFARRWYDSTEALGWGFFMGLHSREFCDEYMAGGNFGIPSNGLLFVAPQMVAHYVEVHGYCPPESFIAAVMESPLPGTKEYLAAVEPFRRLHEQRYERQRQAVIERAARCALDEGGSPEAINEVAIRYFGGSSPEVCEWIRQAMKSLVNLPGE
jgi:hypothetical protein